MPFKRFAVSRSRRSSSPVETSLSPSVEISRARIRMNTSSSTLVLRGCWDRATGLTGPQSSAILAKWPRLSS